MNPLEIYNSIYNYIEEDSIICDLNSACKNHNYLCGQISSNKKVVNFDIVKHKWCKKNKIPDIKSVDAITNSYSNNYFCFIELKSWEKVINPKNKKSDVKESDIEKQAKKYESDLPKKLTNSIETCKQINTNNDLFDNCKIIFILVTDISVNDDGISNIYLNRTALAGTSSDLKKLCNQLSKNIMNNIPNIETHYWHCKDFDTKLSKL
jgi:hypothetical protein